MSHETHISTIQSTTGRDRPSWAECIPRLAFHFGRWWLVGAFLLAIVIVFARAPMTKVPDALFVSDGFGYYIHLPTVWIDGDLDYSNQITRLPYEGNKAFYQVSEVTGRRTNQFPIGSAILWAPAFVLADGLVAALNAVGVDTPRTGFGFAYEMPVYLLSFAWGLAGIWMTRKLLRLLFETDVADWTLFAIVFATPTFYYIWFEANMSHTVAMFLVALWLYQLVRIDQTRHRQLAYWILLGITLGFIALVRPYNAVLGLAAIPVAWRVWQPAGGRGNLFGAIGVLLTCCLTAIAVLTPQVLVWRYLYGSWIAVPSGSGYEALSWFGPRVASYALSIVALFPVYLAAFWGCIRPGLDRRTTAAHSAKTDSAATDVLNWLMPFALVALIISNWVAASSRDWMLGTAFGQRRVVDWTPVLALGLGIVLSRQVRFLRNAYLQYVLVAASVVCTAIIPVYLFTRLIPQYGRVW